MASGGRHKQINFANPLNGRRWLRLLAPDKRYGIRFKNNLRLGHEHLGFSFSSNALGLRGPSNRSAPNVVLGTSFGMGLSVDDGANWYELILDGSHWFNGSMPVGPRNQLNLLDDLYCGEYRNLVYLYHPNIWKTADSYAKASRAGVDIFSFMRWKVNLGSTLILYPRWVLKELVKGLSGDAVFAKWSGSDFFFNAKYVMVDSDRDRTVLADTMKDLNELFSRFERVHVFRVPIKEEAALGAVESKKLAALAASYDDCWRFFVDSATSNVTVRELPRELFGAAAFHPFDTHWTKAGNLTFAKFVRDALSEADVLGLL